MIKKLFSAHNSNAQRGQSLVEMALTLPVVLMLLMGIMDFGRMMFLYSQVSNAAREGARYGSVTGPSQISPQYLDCAAIRDATRQILGIEQPIADEDITIQYDTGDTLYGFECDDNPSRESIQPEDRIRVTVETDFQFLTPLVQVVAPAAWSVEFTAARTILKEGTLTQGGRP